MLESLRMITALVTGIGVVLLFAAAVGRLPRRATLALLAVAEVAVVAGAVSYTHLTLPTNREV